MVTSSKPKFELNPKYAVLSDVAPPEDQDRTFLNSASKKPMKALTFALGKRLEV